MCHLLITQHEASILLLPICTFVLAKPRIASYSLLFSAPELHARDVIVYTGISLVVQWEILKVTTLAGCAYCAQSDGRELAKKNQRNFHGLTVLRICSGSMKRSCESKCLFDSAHVSVLGSDIHDS